MEAVGHHRAFRHGILQPVDAEQVLVGENGDAVMVVFQKSRSRRGRGTVRAGPDLSLWQPLQQPASTLHQVAEADRILVVLGHAPVRRCMSERHGGVGRRGSRRHVMVKPVSSLHAPVSRAVRGATTGLARALSGLRSRLGFAGLAVLGWVSPGLAVLGCDQDAAVLACVPRAPAERSGGWYTVRRTVLRALDDSAPLLWNGTSCIRPAGSFCGRRWCAGAGLLPHGGRGSFCGRSWCPPGWLVSPTAGAGSFCGRSWDRAGGFRGGDAGEGLDQRVGEGWACGAGRMRRTSRGHPSRSEHRWAVSRSAAASP